MPVQSKRLADRIGGSLLASEDVAAPLMEQLLVDELVHGSCRLKRGVQLNDRFGPEQPLVKFPIDPGGYLRVSDDDETARVVRVVGY